MAKIKINNVDVVNKSNITNILAELAAKNKLEIFDMGTGIVLPGSIVETVAVNRIWELGIFLVDRWWMSARCIHPGEYDKKDRFIASFKPIDVDGKYADIITYLRKELVNGNIIIFEPGLGERIMSHHIHNISEYADKIQVSIAPSWYRYALRRW